MRVVFRKDAQIIWEGDGVGGVSVSPSPFPILVVNGLIEGSAPLFCVIPGPGISWEQGPDLTFIKKDILL